MPISPDCAGSVFSVGADRRRGRVERDILTAHGISRRVFPATDRPWRTPLVMFEPFDPGNLDAIGFDMFTDPPRREALQLAFASSEPQVTGRIELGQAIGNAQTYPGFLAFSRIETMHTARADGAPEPETAGFLYAAFRAGDLFNTALGKSPLLPINVEIYDSAVDPDNILFRSEARPDVSLGDTLAVTRRTQVAGRTWELVFRPTATFTPPTSQSVVYLIAAAGLLLAVAIAYLARLQSRAHAIETSLRMSVEKSLKERDLMLQEMKHRIKNSIAKMLAIARQTAANSSSIKDFTVVVQRAHAGDGRFAGHADAFAMAEGRSRQAAAHRARTGVRHRISTSCICPGRRSSSTRPRPRRSD